MARFCGTQKSTICSKGKTLFPIFCLSMTQLHCNTKVILIRPNSSEHVLYSLYCIALWKSYEHYCRYYCGKEIEPSTVNVRPIPMSIKKKDKLKAARSFSFANSVHKRDGPMISFGTVLSVKNSNQYCQCIVSIRTRCLTGPNRVP